MATIGFGYTGSYELKEFKHEYGILCDEFNYGYENGIEAFDEESCVGIKSISEIFNLSELVALRSPKIYPGNLAIDIENELDQIDFKNLEPKFFIFLEKIFQFIECHNVDNFHVFFAHEWYENSKIRYVDGGIEDILNILKSSSNWKLRIFNCKTKRFQNYYDMPLLFKYINAPSKCPDRIE